jgi:hypothetical protein
MSSVEIHRELCAAVYGQNVMSEGTVRQWCRLFKAGRTNVHDEELSGLPSVVSDDLVQSVDQKICERRRFKISKLSCEFPQVSHTLLHVVITVRLGYHKFCAKWVPKMLTGAHKTQRMASALTFLERYHRDGDGFLSHIIIRVTSDETWVSFVNIETKEQSKFKQTSACQKTDVNCFLGQERSAGGGINATRDHNNVRSVMRNTEKKLHRTIRNKRRGMLTYGVLVVLLHEDARPHAAIPTLNTAGAFQLGVV